MKIKIKKFKTAITAGVILLTLNVSVDAQTSSKRKTISLNGTWQVAEGKKDVVPNRFDHTIQVPGLVSLARPAFDNVGPTVKDRRSVSHGDSLREAFWYRRRFSINSDVPAVAMLKISKAMFGTKVFLNGKDMGEHLPNFTPAFLDLKDAIKRGENELIIRVGSSPDAVPLSIPNGFDFEKERYIPGIYDNVQLILSGTPNIIRVQTVPNIIEKKLRVQLNLGNISETSNVSFTIKEVKSQKVAGVLSEKVNALVSSKDTIITVDIPVANCHFWSPEDPFLYKLEVTTAADALETQFGMREFHFDQVTKKGVLNGKPYFMRGSNVTLYRFFEDSTSKDLPWNAKWVRDLHKSFKKFHWNSLRYCIGLPPEEWYRVADEEGFLIQDEFPVWYGGIGWNTWPPELKSDELVKEYTEWMHENWNHPSVVIWDGSNETVSDNGTTNDQTGEAVWQVRNLDLSNRPWDNSYSSHRAPGDVYEAHPYHFQDSSFKLQDISKVTPIPEGNQFKNTENFPVIINEYGWLWLNRDGLPTTLTKDLYKNLLGENATVAQRRHLYAMYTAAESEFWRAHRNAAGVLHFTALGYSRADGQTSDHFIDPAKLEYESEFLKYVPDAFSPVGVMLDEWGADIQTRKAHDFKIIAINDLDPAWNGFVHLQILKDGKVMTDKSRPLTISPYGKTAISFTCETPQEAGLYTVQAVLEKKDAKPVKSVREISFK